jgi:hypothetical protein
MRNEMLLSFALFVFCIELEGSKCQNDTEFEMKARKQLHSKLLVMGKCCRDKG